MATYVLVGGAWLGGWCWQPIARRLRDQGHDAYPVTLTGLGERVHLASPQIILEALKAPERSGAGFSATVVQPVSLKPRPSRRRAHCPCRAARGCRCPGSRLERKRKDIGWAKVQARRQEAIR
jgi:hypothetical protein